MKILSIMKKEWQLKRSNRIPAYCYNIRQEKAAKRGGFEKRLLLIEVRSEE